MSDLSFIPAETSGVGLVPVQSRYVERFWLPVCGPSTLALVRLLSNETPATGFRIPTDELACWLGLRASKLAETIQRACAFRLLIYRGDATYAVPSHVPMLSGRQIARLSGAMQTIHGRVLERAS